ncbi:MAG TPA: hypothetical protein VGP20_11055 [Steroidobacteraceae bacterium]|jgi:hypothetical protein|nr:hypothetical protein [Steroidobacteraceae bacterium]
MAQGRNPGFQVVVSLADKFTRPIDGLNKKIAGATAGLRSLGARGIAAAKSIGLDKVGAAVGGVGKSVLNLRNAIAGTIAPFARLGVIAGGIGLATMVKDAIQTGDSLIKMSQSTGIAVEQLQRLQYAGKQEGVGADTITSSVGKMNAVLAKSSVIGKKLTEQQKALTGSGRGLGFTMKEMRAGTIDSNEALLRLADRVANATTHTEKMRIATAVLGKGAKEMLPFLNQGRAGIEKHGKAAAVMSLELAQASKAFGDTMTTLAEHAKGIAYAVLDELLPSMNGAASGMDEWMQANKADIIEGVTTAVRTLAEVFKALYEAIKVIVPIVKAVVTPMWEALTAVIGDSNAKLLVFGLVVAPKVVGAVAGLAKSIGVLAYSVGKTLVLAAWAATKAVIGFGLALLANPIGLAIAAIVALGAAVYLIYKYWEPISEFFSGIWESIKAAFWAVLGWIGEFVEQFIPDELYQAWAAFSEWFAGVWPGIKAGFWAAIDWIGEFVDQFIPEPIKEAWAAFSEWIVGLWPGIKETFWAVLKWIGEFAEQFVPEELYAAWDTVAKFFEDTWKSVVGWFDWAWEKIQPIIGFITGAIDKVKAGWDWATSWWSGKKEAPPAPAPEAQVTKAVASAAAAATKTAAPAARAAAPPATARAAGPAAAAGAPTAAAGAKELAAAGPQALQAAGQQIEAAKQILQAAQQMMNAKAQIQVTFANAPEGMRVNQGGATGNLEVSLRTEYAGPRGALAGAY